ncbi:DUF6542 domain-containing protein [Streptomyces fumanus]|uniref:Membrane protein n=1 Tax=Streptomyces fumanus TaxID=67302 RepID=A0A919AKI0_9ACTN|nr:DUF6542 domain-containing protein [Streptomyces fumanus]GHF11835.1 membrane protein [Streptomyces fumanus]
MEQPRTRPAEDGTRRGRPPLPPQARGAAPVRRPGVRRPSAPPAPGTGRTLPGPRLTGLGGGLFCAALMLVLGFLDQALFGSSRTVYGVLFLPVCVLTSVWVRPGDLLIAPIVVPLAFALGLTRISDGGDGLSGQVGGYVTTLATEVGWLYGGTLIAGVIVLVRRVRVVRRRVAARGRTAA